MAHTDALYEALTTNEIAHAALDVTNRELMPVAHPILTLLNVIVDLPHVRQLQRSYVDRQTHAAREVVHVLQGDPPTTKVNDPWLVDEAQDQGFGVL